MSYHARANMSSKLVVQQGRALFIPPKSAWIREREKERKSELAREAEQKQKEEDCSSARMRLTV